MRPKHAQTIMANLDKFGCQKRMTFQTAWTAVWSRQITSFASAANLIQCNNKMPPSFPALLHERSLPSPCWRPPPSAWKLKPVADSQSNANVYSVHKRHKPSTLKKALLLIRSYAKWCHVNGHYATHGYANKDARQHSGAWGSIQDVSMRASIFIDLTKGLAVYRLCAQDPNRTHASLKLADWCLNFLTQQRCLANHGNGVAQSCHETWAQVGFAMANFLTCAGALHRGAKNGGPKHLMLILFSLNLYSCDCAKLLKCWEKMLPYVADNGLNYIGWICRKSFETKQAKK